MRAIRQFLLPVFSSVLIACGGGSSSPAPAPVVAPPGEPTVTVDAGVKQLIFGWEAVPGASYYRLLENPDGGSGFTQVGGTIPGGTLTVAKPVAVHLHDWVNALYTVQACNVAGCTGSSEVSAMNEMVDAIGYVKASNTGAGDWFGEPVALSADGSTLAVAAPSEESRATGIDGDQYDNSFSSAGAVYVFRWNGADWYQQAYVKASNSGPTDSFGYAVALSANGNTLAVGAPYEKSSATGVNGDQDDNSVDDNGAVYLFRFDGTGWIQQAYIKDSDGRRNSHFGSSVALSGDGSRLAVGAPGEGYDSVPGAAYVFDFDGDDWFEQAYIPTPNAGFTGDAFGWAVSLSADAATLAVGAINDGRGAVFLFRHDGADWHQQAYLKASNYDGAYLFGEAVALSTSGDTLAVGDRGERNAATGINAGEIDNVSDGAGAVYVFRFDGTEWYEQAYIKASNTDSQDHFGISLAMTSDGNTLAVGASVEDSGGAGIPYNQYDNSAENSGAVYVFRFDGVEWYQHAMIKASNAESGDGFGGSIGMDADGSLLAVGASSEDSSAAGINGDQHDNSIRNSGAVFLY